MKKKLMTAMMTTMMTSISEVFETMFFLPVEPEEKEQLINEGLEQYTPYMACKLNFSGDYSGRIVFAIPTRLLEEMAENFMGEPKKNLTKEHLAGTLTESLNMICGNALKKIESQNPFALDIPEIINNSKIDQTLLFNIIKTPDCAMAMNISSSQ